MGAGATQGAAKFHGFQKSLLMDDDLICEVTEVLPKDKVEGIDWAINQLISGANLERLISLYEYSGTLKHMTIAKALRNAFKSALEKRIIEIDEDFIPELFVALLDMHRVKGIDEELVAIFTTNYEDLLERSISKIYGSVNYAIQIKSVGKTLPSTTSPTFPVLKMHGSFIVKYHTFNTY